MFHSPVRPGFRRIIFVVFACCVWISGTRLSAQTPEPQPQDAPAKPDSGATPTPSVAAGQNEEVSSHDTPTTFKVRVNLGLVRVVVPDQQGKIVSNLKKENFQLYDNRTPLPISSFSLAHQD